MPDRDDADQFIERFLEETSRHLIEIDDCLLAMQRGGGEGPRARLDDMVGLFHSIKGNALMMGFDGLCDVCRRMEEILSRCRKHGLVPDEADIGRIHRTVAIMAHWLESPEQLGLAIPEGLEGMCNELDTSISPPAESGDDIDWERLMPAECPMRGETTGATHRISLREGHSPADTAAIQDALNSVEEAALRGTVVLDLEGFPTMSSMLIGTLVAMHKRLLERGQRLAVCSPTPAVLDLLQSSGINRFVRIYPDFETAVVNEDR